MLHPFFLSLVPSRTSPFPFGHALIFSRNALAATSTTSSLTAFLNEKHNIAYLLSDPPRALQSNERILAAKARHDQKYPKPLIDRLKSELSGSMEDVVLALIRGEREEDLVRCSMRSQAGFGLVGATRFVCRRMSACPLLCPRSTAVCSTSIRWLFLMEACST